MSTITLTGNGTSYTPFYLYTETLSRTDAGSFTSSGTLSFYGTSATNPPSTVGTFSIGYQNALLGSAADTGALYGGFRSNSSGGAYTLDNFSVSDPFATPEPASLGLCACAAVFLGRRRRVAVGSAL